MNNIEVYIVVEGKTEQTFVRDVLAPYMALRGVYLSAMRIGVPGHKGGNVRFERAQQDIGRLLQQRSDIYVSTMFDFFRIDSYWPGLENIRDRIQQGITFSAVEKAKVLERATLTKLKAQLPAYEIEKRFIPYIEMHEFEALLFSDANILADKIKISVQKINAILADYNSPEDINSESSKAPSKRLEKWVTGYKKVIMGKVISESIGIEKIRQECLHFDCWLRHLEHLSL